MVKFARIIQIETLSEFFQADFSFSHLTQPLLDERQAQRDLRERFAALNRPFRPALVESADLREQTALSLRKLFFCLTQSFAKLRPSSGTPERGEWAELLAERDPNSWSAICSTSTTFRIIRPDQASIWPSARLPELEH